MMKDMLDMVNFVADSHSMSDALDTYDTISGVGRAALSTQRGATTHMTPHTKSGISNIQGSTGTLLIPISRAGL